VGTGVALEAITTDEDEAPGCGLPQSFSYAWRLLEVPGGSVATLANERGRVASLRPDVPGTYVAEVVATDATGRASRPAEARVEVDACGLSSPVALPARLAPGKPTPCGAAPLVTDLAGGRWVLLDGGDSSDPDMLECGLAQRLDYSWTLLSAPLSGGASRLEYDRGKTVALRVTSDGEYRVRLVVTDSTGRASNPADCTLLVTRASS
jgi:hypothetical protein